MKKYRLIFNLIIISIIISIILVQSIIDYTYVLKDVDYILNSYHVIDIKNIIITNLDQGHIKQCYIEISQLYQDHFKRTEDFLLKPWSYVTWHLTVTDMYLEAKYYSIYRNNIFLYLTQYFFPMTKYLIIYNISIPVLYLIRKILLVIGIISYILKLIIIVKKKVN